MKGLLQEDSEQDIKILLGGNSPVLMAQRVGTGIAMALGIVAETVLAIINVAISGVNWIVEHWMETVVGLMLWSISSMLFGLVCGSWIKGRATSNWGRFLIFAIVFLAATVSFVVWRINLESYIRPVVIQ